MAEILPFRGLRYNPALVPDLSRAIAPPYDIITPDEQELLYRASPHNIIRLELAREEAEGPPGDRYLQAAATLQGWIDRKVLIREESPAFYLLEHSFPYRGQERRRWGLLARVRLEELSPKGNIRPHEATLKGPKADRLALLRACRVNISPIMGLFRRHGLSNLIPRLAGLPPTSQAQDTYGVGYKIWAIADEGLVREITQAFSREPLYIADGHHRYETALAYSQEMGPAPAATGYVMMALLGAFDPGLVLLPTHRLVRGLSPTRAAGLALELSRTFAVEPQPTPQASYADTLAGWLEALARAGREGPCFGLYLAGGGFSLVRLPPASLNPLHPGQALDVSRLHQLVVGPICGIEGSGEEQRCLDYTRDGLEARARVDAGEFQAALYLNPPSIEQTLAVADAGERVPQKSTYFYPKLPAGLVLNPLWD